jgi:type I restriction enzyme M protein
MITTKNLKPVLEALGFSSKGDIYTKKFESFDCYLKVDFKKGEIVYPEKKGLKVNERQTCNLKSNENFVVLECVNRLLEKGYNPTHIELEPKWKVGHGASGGRADILVKDNSSKALLIIECKNAGTEFTKHWKETLENGGQLFGYAQQEGNAKFLSLYASDFIDEKIKESYYLIKLEDNKQYLEDNPKLLAFKDAKIREELFSVWKTTYQKDYTTKGLFDDDIQAYKIGKKKYTVNDLSLVDSSTKQSKHHDFATILRKYNVSGRENAFDKLVNLFLCKIVDEKNNPKDLQFYWKGIAYDTPFELQDRLQKLYKVGMDEFLKEEVTYIDNKQIDKAFWAFKNDPDATRETIKGYFKQLKFFTNNDFAFIDVHNERLFYENAEVLIDIVRLFQDTKIKSKSKNQFLGDMFENFLDSGVKQSEGQFFTPMPITRFIMQSLPLESIINESQQPPKAIDYACGSGHFLNELASQIRPFVEATKDAKIEDYHKEIYGIEKEYRLSKVAKVSAFMYGQDNIDLTYADALAKNEKFKNDSFKILVANPPYSVKGFLSTLDQDSKQTYNLINTIDSKAIQTNNSIECFFIERAKQLLDADGVCAIIIPPSILSNADSTYQETRSIILKHFSIVAIAEFGSGTFGKTGTDTVTLFLKRRNEKPSLAEHYQNRVNSWFTNDSKKQQVFEDEQYIKQYCIHLEYDFEDYKTLLKGEPNKTLLEIEMFSDYKTAFDKKTSIKNKKKQSSFKKLEKTEQEKELKELFVAYLTKIEKEKLYYFTLASSNQNEVVIVKAPSDNKANKKFLGYEWSGRKGDEGIKLNTNDKGQHITPLYDETNRDNTNKINYYIQQAFENKKNQIPEDLKTFVSQSNLVNMLDFKRLDFNKQFSLTPKKIINIQTKWKLEKLSNLIEAKNVINGFAFKSKNLIDNKADDTFLPVLKIGNIITNQYEVGFKKNTQFHIYKNYKSKICDNGDLAIALTGATVGKSGWVKEKCLLNQRVLAIKKGQKDLDYFSIYILSNNFYEYAQSFAYGGAQGNLSPEQTLDFKIPLPPKDIQRKIVKDCEAIDKEKEKSEQNIRKAISEIEKSYETLFAKANKEFRLSNSKDFKAFIGKRVIQKEIEDTETGTPIYSANVFQPFGYINKEFITDFSMDSVLWGIDGDWMVNVIEKNKPFYPTDHCGVLRVLTNEIHPKYLAWVLLKEGEKVRFSRSHRASTERVKGIKIKAPSITEQNKAVKQIEKQEQIIAKSKETIENIADRKQAVLKNYL